jgi:cytochrome P450
MMTLADILDLGARKPAPGPRGHPLLGSLPEARRDPIKLFLKSFRDHGEVVRFRFGPMVAHLVSSPSGVNHILAENNKNYGKQTRGYASLRYVLGNGLLTAEGEFWKRQRRIAQPAFHRQRIASFGRAMVRAASQAAESFEARRGQVIDVAEEMMRLTLRIVGETLLGYDPSDAAGEVGPALGFLLAMVNERTSRLLFFGRPILPTPENFRIRRSLSTLDSIVLRIIAERRKRPGDDLLSMLMEATDESTGEKMDDRQLRDEAMTIFLAGHETTSNALSWTWLLLSRYSRCARGTG